MSDFFGSLIIPYQGLPGNYNRSRARAMTAEIIPYQGLPGNYNKRLMVGSSASIIPYQGLPGNYNSDDTFGEEYSHYTIPRTTRELQRTGLWLRWRSYYTIPRTTRELQPLPLHRGGRVPGQRQGLTSLFPTAKRHNSPGRETSQRIVKARSDRTSVAGICPALHFVQRILP